ncbi:hypothetical protein B0J18DRAFT_439567, partial [Chaetomium sp. MPI-SDFR-AT-0129]
MRDAGSDRDSDLDNTNSRRTSYPHQEEAHAGSSTPTTAQLIAAQALGLLAPKQGGFTAINAGGGDNGSPSARQSLEPLSRPGSVPNTGAISPDHPYWEPSWKSIENILEPKRQKYQEKYNQLDQSGSTYFYKYGVNRKAKRGRRILEFLQDSDSHPYQLVGKEWIKSSITYYSTFYRLVQLLTDELPKMNLDVTPSEWVRHQLHEQYLKLGDKFDVASWIKNAYHDPKVEQLRTRNGVVRVGHRPAPGRSIS